MLFVMCTAHTYAGQESDISYEVEKDSTKKVKTYDKGDILLTTGGTMFCSGVVTLLGSRHVGFALMGVGGAVAVIGGIIKVANLSNKDGNR